MLSLKAHIMIIKKDKDYIIKIEKRHERYKNMIELKMHLFNRCSSYQRKFKNTAFNRLLKIMFVKKIRNIAKFLLAISTIIHISFIRESFSESNSVKFVSFKIKLQYLQVLTTQCINFYSRSIIFPPLIVCNLFI